MFSHTQISCSHKSKNHREHDEDSGGMTLTPRNPSKPLFLKTLSAPARQSREQPSSSNRDELQQPTLKKTPMKLYVQPEREQTMNMRIMLVMTSVPLLNNLPSLHIIVWKKILSMRTKMRL